MHNDNKNLLKLYKQLSTGKIHCSINNKEGSCAFLKDSVKHIFDKWEYCVEAFRRVQQFYSVGFSDDEAILRERVVRIGKLTEEGGVDFYDVSINIARLKWYLDDIKDKKCDWWKQTAVIILVTAIVSALMSGGVSYGMQKIFSNTEGKSQFIMQCIKCTHNKEHDHVNRKDSEYQKNVFSQNPCCSHRKKTRHDCPGFLQFSKDKKLDREKK